MKDIIIPERGFTDSEVRARIEMLTYSFVADERSNGNPVKEIVNWGFSQRTLFASASLVHRETVADFVSGRVGKLYHSEFKLRMSRYSAEKILIHEYSNPFLKIVFTKAEAENWLVEMEFFSLLSEVDIKLASAVILFYSVIEAAEAEGIRLFDFDYLLDNEWRRLRSFRIFHDDEVVRARDLGISEGWIF